jgi:hypothetical protein
MSDTVVVVGTYVIGLGAVVGYALYLHLRHRRTRG